MRSQLTNRHLKNFSYTRTRSQDVISVLEKCRENNSHVSNGTPLRVDRVVKWEAGRMNLFAFNWFSTSFALDSSCFCEYILGIIDLLQWLFSHHRKWYSSSGMWLRPFRSFGAKQRLRFMVTQMERIRMQSIEFVALKFMADVKVGEKYYLHFNKNLQKWYALSVDAPHKNYFAYLFRLKLLAFVCVCASQRSNGCHIFCSKVLFYVKYFAAEPNPLQSESNLHSELSLISILIHAACNGKINLS